MYTWKDELKASNEAEDFLLKFVKAFSKERGVYNKTLDYFTKQLRDVYLLKAKPQPREIKLLDEAKIAEIEKIIDTLDALLPPKSDDLVCFDKFHDLESTPIIVSYSDILNVKEKLEKLVEKPNEEG